MMEALRFIGGTAIVSHDDLVVRGERVGVKCTVRGGES